DRAVVEHVVDGDTIDVDIGGRDERVRLIGVDTPEVYVDEGPPDCYGPEASAFTKALLAPGTAVRLERDVVGRDDYGRLLAYVYVAADGTFVNDALVRRGLARPLTIAPNATYAARFVAASIDAEADGLGLWGACAG
ncbi:MAG: thermonuclease family protein, partial [Ilumatobacteraceae bacterium]